MSTYSVIDGQFLAHSFLQELSSLQLFLVLYLNQHSVLLQTLKAKRSGMGLIIESLKLYSLETCIYMHLTNLKVTFWKQKDRDEGEKDLMKKNRRQVLFSGIVTAIG